MLLTNQSYARLSGVVGAFFLLFAIASVPINDEVGFWFWLCLIVALPGLGFFVYLHYKELKKKVGSRQALMVLNLVLLVFGFLGCFAWINLIAEKTFSAL